MNLDKQLFQGRTILLAPIDHQNDPATISRWTHDPDYLRLLGPAPAYPQSTARVKKRLEELEKEIEENKNQFYFHIRKRENDQLIGFARLYWIEWTQGNAWLQLGIGDAQERRMGYGSEALELLLVYAFTELNLYRLSASFGEYNPGAQRLFEKYDFREEVRRRKALQRDGQRWDMLLFGLLREEWEKANEYAAS